MIPVAIRIARFSAITAALLATASAAAADPPAHLGDTVTFRADRLQGDVVAGDVTLEGRVAVAVDRYRLQAERLRLHLDGGAVVFTGDARAALCPCPDPPLTFLASGGRFEPPGDLVLRFPRIAIAGVPVFALPWLWLRGPAQIGILPPLVAVRGGDGLLLGSGVHLPWRGAGGATGEGIDLLAGGYVKGGAELGAHLVTASSDTRITADLIQGTRVAVEGRGAFAPEGLRSVGVAYGIDAIRGDRARSGTVDLGAAALPFDTAAAEASLRTGGASVSALFAGGAVARALRGQGPIAAGPRTMLALGGPIGVLGSWNADASGVVLGNGGPGSPAPALPFGRASAGAELDARPGPFELRVSARARGRVAGDGGSAGASSEAAAAARVDLELPFARSFTASEPGEAPLVHSVTPALSLRGAVAAQRGLFFVPIGGVVPPASWIAATGVSTAVGRYAGPALRLDVRAGASGDAGVGVTNALLHARLAADARLAAATIEGAAVGEPVGTTRLGQGTAGAAVIGRVRLGAITGLSLRLDTAGQVGHGAAEARAVAAGAWAALPGDDLAYLAASGWTGGAEVSIPWGLAVRTAGRADVDLDAGTLLAVRGLAEYRHPCGCLGLGVTAAHRTGRDGVDVAFTVDVTPPTRTTPPRSAPALPVANPPR